MRFIENAKHIVSSSNTNRSRGELPSISQKSVKFLFPVNAHINNRHPAVSEVTHAADCRFDRNFVSSRHSSQVELPWAHWLWQADRA